MNELSTIQMQLPETLEDLTQFVLVGQAKLQAYMIKLRTVNKLSVAQEIRDQTLKETQEMSNALIAAEQRIGELLLAIPKQSGGDRRSENFKNQDDMNFEKTKSEIAADMGYSKNDVSDYQQMAKNPEVVQKVIEDALANGEVVTKSQVLKEIKAAREQAKQEAESNNRHMIERLDAQDLRVMQLEAIKKKNEDTLFFEREKSKKRLDAEKRKSEKLQEEITSLREKLQSSENDAPDKNSTGLEDATITELLDKITADLVERIGKSNMSALINASRSGKVIVVENDIDGSVAELASMVGIKVYSHSDIFTLTLIDE